MGLRDFVYISGEIGIGAGIVIGATCSAGHAASGARSGI